MSKNTIKIDGEKLKALLEADTGRTIREISLENGFSKNLISEAVRTGKASPIVQNVARLYGIVPEMYRYIEPDPAPERSQLSIDDISLNISREELKEIVKEALVEVINDCDIRVDSIGRVYID